MKYLLDTDTSVDLLRGREDVVAALRRHFPDDCALSSISQFELFSGALKSRDPESAFAKVQRFVDTIVLVPFDEAAASRAANVRSDLEVQGAKIGAYETLLSGHALALGLVFVTSNTREFSRVEGLELENWRSSGRSGS